MGKKTRRIIGEVLKGVESVAAGKAQADMDAAKLEKEKQGLFDDNNTDRYSGTIDN
jgi:hypothetical protein